MTDASQPVDTGEFFKLNSDTRYNLLINAVQKTNKLWTLADENGCIVIDTGEERCLLLWHEQGLAESWINDDLANAKPMSIDLNDFIEKWVPGMTKDGFEVAVAPCAEGDGIVLSPTEFAEDLVGKRH